MGSLEKQFEDEFSSRAARLMKLPQSKSPKVKPSSQLRGGGTHSDPLHESGIVAFNLTQTLQPTLESQTSLSPLNKKISKSAFSSSSLQRIGGGP
jgi:hypothetical protein